MSKLLFYEAIATLTGTIIGAGVLGIPYVIAQAGFWPGVLYLLVIGAAFLCIHLMLGEVCLRTKGIHQLTGYAMIYLGKWGKRAMAFSMIFGIYGALVAYTIGEGTTLAEIFGLNQWLWSAVFFVAAAIIIRLGLKAIEESEFGMELAKFAAFAVIFIVAVSSSNFSTSALSGFSLPKLFLPYGVILFAFIGTSAIPELREELSRNPQRMKKAIIIGSIIPFIVYLLFTIAVIGTTGAATTDIATVGLGRVLGSYAMFIVNLFAMLAMFTSFIALGYALMGMYVHDYKLKSGPAWLLTIVIPAALVLAGASSFIKVLEVTGSVTGGLTGVLIVLMYWKSKKHGDRKPEYSLRSVRIVGYLLMAMFIIGAIYSLIPGF